ncbi:MAG TPA: metallophosphoesterase, partial [Rhodopila sp.]|nr:metallophosphoesterase [Rhodopila sp.]
MRRPPRRPGLRAALQAAAIPTFSSAPLQTDSIHFQRAAGWMPRGRRAYAIGDIHGCRDKLETLHARIAADLMARPVRSAVLVHIGDYIDQGPDSAGVVSLL